MPLAAGESRALKRGLVEVTIENFDTGVGDAGAELTVHFWMRRTDTEEGFDGEGQFEDTAYWCGVSVRAADEELSRLLNFIMEAVYERIMNGQQMKRAAERLSWLALEDLDEDVETFMLKGPMVLPASTNVSAADSVN